MSRRRVALGIGANLLDRFVGLGLQLAMVPILASHWGLERYGGWAMLTTVPGILVLSDLGFATAATVRMTMQIARGELEAARATMHSATQVVLGACLVIMAVALGAMAVLPDSALLTLPQTSPQDVRTAILCLAGYASLVILSGLILGVFRSNQRFAQGSLLSTVTLLLENGLVIAVVALGHGIAAGAMALLTGRFIGIFLAFAVAANLRTGVLPGVSAATPDVRRELLAPALAAMAIPLAHALLLQGTVVALGFAAGSAAIPAFLAARTLSRIGLQAAQTLAIPIMPAFGASSARGETRSVRRMFATILFVTGAIALGNAFILATFGDAIIDIWSNNKIQASTNLILLIAISAFFSSIWNPLSNLLLAVNKHKAFSISYVFVTIAGVSATYFLAKLSGYGAESAALAVAGVDFTMIAIILFVSFKNWGKPSDLILDFMYILKDYSRHLWHAIGRRRI